MLAHQRTSLQNGERHFSEGLRLAGVKQRERENPGVWEAEEAVTHLVGLERSRGENLTDRAGLLSAPPMSEHLLSDKNRTGDNCSR